MFKALIKLFVETEWRIMILEDLRGMKCGFFI